MPTRSIERAWDAEADVERVLAELRDALERMRSLGTLVRVCSGCEAVRDERGAWISLEEYLADRLRVRFSHCLCPECSARMRAGLDGEPRARASRATVATAPQGAATPGRGADTSCRSSGSSVSSTFSTTIS